MGVIVKATRRVTRRRAALTVLALWALPATIACAQAASVLFDLPEPAPETTRRADTSAVGPGMVPFLQDTTPAAIEAVQDPDSVLALLPKHESGGIDWVKAVRHEIVKPRKAPPGATDPGYIEAFAFDFKLPGPDPMFDAVYPHSAHVQWLACQTCHPAVVPYKDNPSSMELINEGQSCGVCHGIVAFAVEACGRCHPTMPPGELTATLENDVVLARAADGSEEAAGVFPPAEFAHWIHRIRYRCSACHNTLFAMEAGTDTLTMAEMSEGKACGACHDGGAVFGLMECNTCHPPAASSGESPPP